MAYQTGTAADFVALANAIRAFAESAGWTTNMWAVNTGADWRLHISKGSQYVNFLAQPTTSLWIVGSDGYDAGAAWNAQPFSSPQTVRMVAAVNWQPFGGPLVWPVTYHLFAHASPDSIEIVIEMFPGTYQWMMFGQLKKFGAWTGGSYVGASWGTNLDRATLGGFSAMYAGSSEKIGGDFPYITNPGLFCSSSQIFVSPTVGDRYENCYLRAGLDSQTWISTPAPSANAPRCHADLHSHPLVARGVSAFNGLTVLQPIWPMMYRPDAHWSCLGRVEHVRYANVINHLPGQVIDLGPDRWMLFPWMRKGSSTDYAGLHAGFAVRYDGP